MSITQRSIKTINFGEVNPRLGIIILSWKHFIEGFIDNEDGRNLAFHEMAHAIFFEIRSGIKSMTF